MSLANSTFNATDRPAEASTKGLEELGVFSSVIGHLGDGNFHEAIMYHKSSPLEAAAVEKHVKKMITRALEMDGTSTVSVPIICSDVPTNIG